MNLNIGCGSVRMEGYIGVDVYPFEAVDVVADAAKLPFADQSVDRIRCDQVIEHFFPGDIDGLLKEWGRVMKPGGRVYITTPDFEYVAREYVAGRMGVNLARAYICGTVDGLNTYDRNQPESYHRTLWDVVSLQSEFAAVGLQYLRHHNEAWNLHFEAVKA